MRGRQDSVVDLCLRGQILVEVGKIVLHARHIRRRNLLGLKRVQVKICEPWVLQNLVNAVRTKTVFAVLVEKFAD